MAVVTGVFDAVKNIYRGKETWRLKVRVVRMRVICAKENPSNVFSVEMVLVDVEGGRIQASIRKAMLKKFMGNVVEGVVYKMTKVYPCESEIISRFGLDVKSFKEIHRADVDSEYLFDFMGVLTAVSEEKQYEKFNRTIRVLELELTDDRGVVMCSLFGHFIDLMKDYLKNRKNSLHSLSNSTRVLWNPQIEEAVSFRNGIAFHGFDLHAPIKMIGENDRPYSLREEFINHFPRKSIEDLQLMEEDGSFICLASVGEIVKNDMWWYNACKCHKAVTYDDDTNTYYCAGCEVNVSDVTPRFRLRLDVNDITEKAEFVIFDHDASFLLSKTCSSMVGDALELLFKVEVKEDRAFKWDDSFKVKKVCSDEAIIKEFKEESSIKTPEKSTFKTTLTELPGEKLSAEGAVDCHVVIDLSVVCNGGELTPNSAGECSNVAARLAPQKRKAVPVPR
ncbi:hypothetical protein SESBI_49122, partial [Sesbania bispinosa]